MKKLFAALILIATFAAANAQLSVASGPYATPRTYSSKPHTVDNTYRALSQHYYHMRKAGAFATDSIVLAPNAYMTFVYVDSLTDSTLITQAASPNTATYAGDILIFSVTCNATSTVEALKFQNNTFKCVRLTPGYDNGTTSNLYVTTGKRATIEFIFDGAVWNEVARAQLLY